MNIICAYENFVNLIKDRTVEVVNLLDTNIFMENWTPERYVNYLGVLEKHKLETGDQIIYKSVSDHKGRVATIYVNIIISSFACSEEKNYYMQWNVKYKDN